MFQIREIKTAKDIINVSHEDALKQNNHPTNVCSKCILLDVTEICGQCRIISVLNPPRRLALRAGEPSLEDCYDSLNLLLRPPSSTCRKNILTSPQRKKSSAEGGGVFKPSTCPVLFLSVLLIKKQKHKKKLRRVMLLSGFTETSSFVPISRRPPWV